MVHLIQALVPLEFKQMQRPWWEVCLPFLCVLLVFTLLPDASASAANYYVAKNGNDSSPGTQSQPWLTIQHAANQVVAGDTVNVRAGSYNERVVLKNSGNAAGGYITIQNFPGDKPILDGTGLGNGNMVYSLNLSYIKFQGFHIKNHIGAGIEFQGGGEFIEIRNNEISNQTHIGVNGHAILVLGAYSWPYIYSARTNVIIDNNYIHDVQTGVDTAFNEALTVAHNVSKFQITNNVLDNVSYIGIDCIGQTSAGPNKYPREGIIANNEIKNSGTTDADTGIYLDGAKDIVIEGNKVHDNTGYGITISTEDTTFTTERIIVRRNELWNNRRNLAPGATSFGLSQAVRVVHNVVFSNNFGTSNIALFKGDDVVIKNNVSLLNGGGNFHLEHRLGTEFSPSFNFNNQYPPDFWLFQYKGTSYYTLLDYKSATGLDLNSISHDPLFIDASQGDFRLKLGSPCIDSGGFLTTTTSGGNGAIIPVEDSLYFSNGFGVVPGDLVQVGLNSPARIILVDHKTKRITVDRNLAWSTGSSVSYPYIGSAPNMGAHENELGSSSTDLAPSAPTGLQVVETGN